MSSPIRLASVPLLGVLLGVLLVVLTSAGIAHADDRLVKQHAGKIVISPDPVPTEAGALAAYVRANLVKDGAYELIKGAPWEINLVGFLARAPGKRQVTLVIADAGDPKAAPLAVLEVASQQRIVISRAIATAAAGFEEGTTYAVRLMLGKLVLARCTLKLRP